VKTSKEYTFEVLLDRWVSEGYYR